MGQWSVDVRGGCLLVCALFLLEDAQASSLNRRNSKIGACVQPPKGLKVAHLDSSTTQYALNRWNSACRHHVKGRSNGSKRRRAAWVGWGLSLDVSTRSYSSATHDTQRGCRWLASGLRVTEPHARPRRNQTNQSKTKRKTHKKKQKKTFFLLFSLLLFFPFPSGVPHAVLFVFASTAAVNKTTRRSRPVMMPSPSDSPSIGH